MRALLATAALVATLTGCSGDEPKADPETTMLDARQELQEWAHELILNHGPRQVGLAVTAEGFWDHCPYAEGDPDHSFEYRLSGSMTPPSLSWERLRKSLMRQSYLLSVIGDRTHASRDGVEISIWHDGEGYHWESMPALRKCGELSADKAADYRARTGVTEAIR